MHRLARLCVYVRIGVWHLIGRLLAGWDVSVAVSEPHDLRPLQILGVTLATQQRLGLTHAGSGAVSIAIAPGVFENNNHIRSQVLQALDHGAIEVTFVGPSLPSALDGRLA